MIMQMRNPMGLFLTVWLATACSSGEEGQGPVDASTSDTAVQDAGRCVALGTWVLTTTIEGAAPHVEMIVVTESSSGIDVSFEDRETPVDQCLPSTDAGPAMGTSSQTATFEEESCALEVRWSERYCRSGEDQCETLTYTMVVDGDEANGTRTRNAGWCRDTREEESPVAAVRTK